MFLAGHPSSGALLPKIDVPRRRDVPLKKSYPTKRGIASATTKVLPPI